jgi:2-methylcitrate dehydratase PrpD
MSFPDQNPQLEFSEFLTRTTWADIAPRVSSRLADAIVDCLGVAVGGSAEPVVQVIRAVLCETSSDDGSAWLIGDPRRVGAADGALHNAAAAHALDFDDVTHPANAHLTCSIVAALLAVLPGAHPLDDDFLTAYAVGLEVAAKLGTILTRPRRSGPWHPTGVFGAMGAAAAVAKALRLDSEQAGHALGVAASSGAGLTANFGTMTKPLHAGRAAHSGVTAGLLALNGMTASPRAISGFCATFGNLSDGELSDLTAAACARLGDPWEASTDEGLALKAYPSCAETLAPIEAAALLRPAIGGADVAEVYVGCAASALSVLITGPRSGLEAKFSMEFCVAAALLHGELTIDDFSDVRLSDPAIVRLMDHVRVAVDPDPAIRDSHEYAAVVRVALASGGTHERRVMIAKGRAKRWMSQAELRSKFLSAAAKVLGEADAGELFDAVRTPSAGNARTIVSLLTAANRKIT